MAPADGAWHLVDEFVHGEMVLTSFQPTSFPLLFSSASVSAAFPAPLSVRAAEPCVGCWVPSLPAFLRTSLALVLAGAGVRSRELGVQAGPGGR